MILIHLCKDCDYHHGETIRELVCLKQNTLINMFNPQNCPVETIRHQEEVQDQ